MVLQPRPQHDHKRPETMQGWLYQLKTLAATVATQASGVPSGNHGLFHRLDVHFGPDTAGCLSRTWHCWLCLLTLLVVCLAPDTASCVSWDCWLVVSPDSAGWLCLLALLVVSLAWHCWLCFLTLLVACPGTAGCVSWQCWLFLLTLVVNYWLLLTEICSFTFIECGITTALVSLTDSCQSRASL